MDRSAVPWRMACPACRAPLEIVSADAATCRVCAVDYRRDQGIWRFLPPDRGERFAEFVLRYEIVRAAEGRVACEPARLRALPFRPPSRRLAFEWRVRSRSYRAVLRHVLRPIERASGRPLRILDLGSGLGWLAYRLALRGHQVAGVDLVTNDADGLGAHRHYGGAFVSIQAEFDRLPFAGETVDIVVYNASFHYSSDYWETLSEALRVLGPGGRVVIMDSPLYRDPASGLAMVRERQEAFRARHGFAPSRTESEGFLTYARLYALGDACGVTWELFEPWYGVRWWLKPLLARLRRAREPARFKLIVGRPRA